jgi:integrase
MTQNPGRKLDLLKEQIETSDTLSDCDRELLIKFDKRLALLNSEYTTATRYKLLQYCAIMAGQSQEIPQDALPDVELADVLEDREAAEDLVRWMNDRYDNEESNASFRRALRTFARRVTDGDGIPESVEWIPTTLSNNYDPSPNPGDMLHWDEDVLPMIDATLNDRDAALIAVAWDAGARGDELHDLTIGDVTDHKHGLQLTLRGKTGQRTVTLIPSVPFLQQWLNSHPDRNDPNAPLWSKLSSPDSVSYETLWKAVTRAGERAEIAKPVNFTNFRKSSASYLASQGMSQAHLEEHHGWVRGSDVAGRYVAVFGDAADNELARIHDVDVEEDESDPVGPIECHRCGRDTPREEPFCMWCDQALDHGAQEEIETEQREQRTALLRLVQENPEFLDRVEEMEPVIEMFGGDPDLIDTAHRFADALDEG